MSLLVKSRKKAAIQFIIDGGGTGITAGEKGYAVVPFDCNIAEVQLEADQPGSIKVDIWKDNYTNFPPTNADSICGGNEPEIAAAQKYRDTTLTAWTKALTEADIIAFNVDSVLTIQRCTVILMVEKS